MSEDDFVQAGREWLKNDRLKKLERQSQYNVQYKVNNPDITVSRNKEFRESHPDYMKEYREKYGDELRECVNAYQSIYAKTKKGKATAQRGQFARRHRLGLGLNTLTSSEWLDILKKYNYRCFYCGAKLNADNVPQRDHIIPVSKGGGNIKENVVPACKSCNSKKSMKLVKVLILDEGRNEKCLK